jgi:2-haloacid dehalogenase
MNLDRREFITRAASGAALTAMLSSPLELKAKAPSNTVSIKAIAFDAFPIFDPRAIFKEVKIHFPDRGDDLRKLWFSKIFAYTWLRTAGGRYKDFWRVTEDALLFAASNLHLDLTPEKQEAIMASLLRLPIWPDVKPVLEQLRANNIRLVFLSNMTEDILRANMKLNGIDGFFESVLSTDRAQVFKPDPHAYRLGVDALGLRKEEIAFAAFAGWDAAGASWFGYPSVWVNRLGFPAELLDGKPDHTGKDLSVLTDFVDQKNS